MIIIKCDPNPYTDVNVVYFKKKISKIFVFIFIKFVFSSWRGDKERQQIVIEIENISALYDTANKAKVSETFFT